MYSVPSSNTSPLSIFIFTHSLRVKISNPSTYRHDGTYHRPSCPKSIPSRHPLSTHTGGSHFLTTPFAKYIGKIPQPYFTHTIAHERPAPYNGRMENGFNLFRTSGRAAQPLIAEVTRELVREDLAALQTEKGSVSSPIKRIGERHHALARLLAGGMSPGDAAITSGYCSSRVSILLGDPAFKELLEFYRNDINAVYRSLHERLSGIALDAVDELATRLEDDRESFSNNQLMEVTKLGADRTGHGPSSSTTNLNVNVDLAARLQAARQRVAARTLENIL